MLVQWCMAGFPQCPTCEDQYLCIELSQAVGGEVKTLQQHPISYVGTAHGRLRRQATVQKSITPSNQQEIQRLQDLAGVSL